MHNLVVHMNAFIKMWVCMGLVNLLQKQCVKLILEKYIPRYGHVKNILWDQEQFQNKKWHSELEKYGIQTILTPICRPEGRLVEWVNKELGKLFHTYLIVRLTKGYGLSFSNFSRIPSTGVTMIQPDIPLGNSRWLDNQKEYGVSISTKLALKMY